MCVTRQQTAMFHNRNDKTDWAEHLAVLKGPKGQCSILHEAFSLFCPSLSLTKVVFYQVSQKPTEDTSKVSLRWIHMHFWPWHHCNWLNLGFSNQVPNLQRSEALCGYIFSSVLREMTSWVRQLRIEMFTAFLVCLLSRLWPHWSLQQWDCNL